MTGQFPVDEKNTRAWTEIAQGARLHNHMFSAVADPAPGSNFEMINAIYPHEKASDWSRAYVVAAYEHLIHWADFIAPFKFHEDQTTRQTLRPAYTLARAALEASAQAVWMLEGGSVKECARRHLSLIRWDFDEHRKSKASDEDKQKVKDREAVLIERCAEIFTEPETRKPNGYLPVIRDAAQYIDTDPDELERIWRAASGAAHGKYWPSLDLQYVLLGDEYEPGHHRTTRVPDADGITEVLKVAYDMSSVASRRYAHHAGADVNALYIRARQWLIEQVTLKDDADPEILKRLRGSELG